MHKRDFGRVLAATWGERQDTHTATAAKSYLPQGLFSVYFLAEAAATCQLPSFA